MADPIAFIDLQAQRRRLGEPRECALKIIEPLNPTNVLFFYVITHGSEITRNRVVEQGLFQSRLCSPLKNVLER